MENSKKNTIKKKEERKGRQGGGGEILKMGEAGKFNIKQHIAYFDHGLIMAIKHQCRVTIINAILNLVNHKKKTD